MISPMQGNACRHLITYKTASGSFRQARPLKAAVWADAGIFHHT